MLLIKHKFDKQNLLLNYKIKLINKIRKQIENIKTFNEILNSSAWTELSNIMTPQEREIYFRIIFVVSNPEQNQDDIKRTILLKQLIKLEKQWKLK